MTKTVTEVKTHLTDSEIAKRVEEVKEYDRFSVFSFEFRSEQHALEVLNSDDILVTSKDGSVYTGHVEDWDDAKYYVNLD